MHDYVHGYSDREAERLQDQADAVRELIHHDTSYPAGSRVLEAGCGVGAQTVTLASRSPQATIVSVDLSADSLRRAQALVAEHGLRNVVFENADLYDLPYPPASFDHAFLCFVLEHLTEPERVLTEIHRVIRPGGTLTVVEGDHGSCYFYPETTEARLAWHCLIDAQARMGGNSLIGRQLYALLHAGGFNAARISPRMLYMDASHPQLMEAFVRRTIVPMVEGVKDQALEWGMITEAVWQEGITDLLNIANDARGAFCYTFFKAFAAKQLTQ